MSYQNRIQECRTLWACFGEYFGETCFWRHSIDNKQGHRALRVNAYVLIRNSFWCDNPRISGQNGFYSKTTFYDKNLIYLSKI